MSKDIPDLAIRDALRRLDRPALSPEMVRESDSSFARAILLAAELIAKHEEPPADPLQEAVIGALDELPSGTGTIDTLCFEKRSDYGDDAAAFIAELRKRGVTIGGAS